jgi:hypothetical protein
MQLAESSAAVAPRRIGYCFEFLVVTARPADHFTKPARIFDARPTVPLRRLSSGKFRVNAMEATHRLNSDQLKEILNSSLKSF